MRYLTELLNKTHSIENFNCDDATLDNYIRHLAQQDVKRKLSICFVWSISNKNVIGYYTLSTSSIKKSSLPHDISKKLPKAYIDLPVILIGRFALDKGMQNKGNGIVLLSDALQRCYDLTEDTLGSVAVVIDPKNQPARNFYKKHGFIELHDSKRMVITMKTIQKLIRDENY